MKLKCHIARIAMSWADIGAEPQRWVMSHIKRCDGCRAELEALRAVRSLLREKSSERACPVEWADIRASLPERATARRPMLQLAVSIAACATLVITGAIWVRGVSPHRDQRTLHSGIARVTKSAAKQPVVVHKKELGPTTVVRVAKSAPSGKTVSAKPTKRRTRRHHRRIPPHRLMVRRDPIPEPRTTAPEPPIIVAVAPVERVIGIVGVSLDIGDEHSYVIREVSAGQTGQAQCVEL